MPVFLLIRHGETDFVKKHILPGRLEGIYLNKKGRLQAQAVAEKLREAPIKALYSSPLERTMETAGFIATTLGLEVLPRQGLIDLNVGEWQGEKLKGLSRQKAWRSVQFAPSVTRFPGGEAFLEAQSRISLELLSLAASHDPKDLVACVSHADPIRLAVAYFIGLPLDMFQRLSVSPGSITALSIGEMGSRLLTLNFEPSFSFPKP